MNSTILGADDAFPPDPEDWPAPDSSGLSPEALENESDDMALPGSPEPSEADELDVLDQLRDAGPDDEADAWTV
ncbi:hypothetical protein [Tessaracoccus sp. Z1128]